MSQVDPKFIDRYEIMTVLGKGGMGTVYKAFDPRLKKTVAIKIVNSIFCSDSTRIRFQNEAKTLQKLQSPAIPAVFDFGITDSDQPFLVMEFIEGESTKVILERDSSMDVNEACDIVIQLCEILEYAHKNEVVHRDIKPDNIVLQTNKENSNSVKLIDFGLARMVLSDEDFQRLTKTGAILGTPAYMSPEQASSNPGDNRSDIYSLGCVLFEFLTGEKLFYGRSELDTIRMHISSIPRRLSSVDENIEFPEELEKILAKCLAKEPDSRYQSVWDLKNDLHTFVSGKSQELVDPPASLEKETKTNMPVVVGLISFFIFIGFGALLFLNLSPRQDETVLKSLDAFYSERKTNKESSKESNNTEIHMKDIEVEYVKIEKGLVTFNWAIDDAYLATYKFPEKTSIVFDRSKISAIGLRCLPKNIEFLQFDDTPITNEMLDVIVTRFPRLHSLDFNKPVAFPVGGIDKLRRAKALTSLTYLKLNEGYTREEFIAISALKKLSFLSIEQKSITPKLISYLKSLPELSRLELRYLDVSENILKAVAELPRLKSLTLVCCAFRSQDLLVLSGSKVDRLKILRWDFSPSASKVMQKLKKLRILEVSDSPENRKAFAQLPGKPKVFFVASKEKIGK